MLFECHVIGAMTGLAFHAANAVVICNGSLPRAVRWHYIGLLVYALPLAFTGNPMLSWWLGMLGFWAGFVGLVLRDRALLDRAGGIAPD